jgi:hypothetical protein
MVNSVPEGVNSVPEGMNSVPEGVNSRFENNGVGFGVWLKVHEGEASVIAGEYGPSIIQRKMQLNV